MYVLRGHACRFGMNVRLNECTGGYHSTERGDSSLVLVTLSCGEAEHLCTSLRKHQDKTRTKDETPRHTIECLYRNTANADADAPAPSYRHRFISSPQGHRNCSTMLNLPSTARVEWADLTFQPLVSTAEIDLTCISVFPLPHASPLTSCAPRPLRQTAVEPALPSPIPDA